ncbi:MAG: S26 family signal peptidase [Bacteroidaceae bacterium]|jgi:signal peptidase I|nr:S26 family signal peptidase [Bacteroidaceae bacterium]
MEKQQNQHKKATPKNWIKFTFWTILYLLFLAWLGSWWAVIFIPFIFDAYITKKIPWGWWRNSKNKTTRQVMSWVDAIVFALVAVYFVNLYFFQNYVIPSSSLEKSLLTGDYLFVSKMSYGPRTPNTPLHMPLTSHTIPLLGTKSFISWPQWDYRRIKGFGHIKQNDIVVFNYPAGDTVAAKIQDQDYYAMCYEIGQQLYPSNLSGLSPQAQMQAFQTIYNVGRDYILSNPDKFGKLLARPVDMRENYVKRCVGLPGQWLRIKNGLVYINGKLNKQPDNVQYSYIVTLKYDIPEDFCKEYGISMEDRSETVSENNFNVRRMPLTKRAYDALKKRTDMVVSITPSPSTDGIMLYPHYKITGWNCNNYGPIWIPKKGKTMKLNLASLPLYLRPIQIYEHNKVEVRDGKIFINDKVANSYTFKMDYYWMMGDNRDNSADSRFWGFVPEDHIVGKPIMIWLSLNKDYGWFDGKIRWNRLFRFVDNIK